MSDDLFSPFRYIHQRIDCERLALFRILAGDIESAKLEQAKKVGATGTVNTCMSPM